MLGTQSASQKFPKFESRAGLKMAKRQLTMTNVLDELQSA
jgi:hypothetical protein